MGHGIEWMIGVSLWVTSLPGALGRLAAFGTGPLLICSLGLVVLCLLKSLLRCIGVALIGGAVVMMVQEPQPDILVAAGGRAVAMRGVDGRLAIVQSGNDAFAVRAWLAADGDARSPKDATLGNGIRCDAAGCAGKLRDGTLVAIANSIEAFQEDCRRAAVVVSARDAPPDCDAVVIDRQVSGRSGAMSLRRVGERFEITPARPAGYDRPWARSAVPAAGSGEAATATNCRQPSDATPRAEDLEAGD